MTVFNEAKKTVEARALAAVRQARCSGLFRRVYRLDFAELEKA
jgi:hypothetical protein